MRFLPMISRLKTGCPFVIRIPCRYGFAPVSRTPPGAFGNHRRFPERPGFQDLCCFLFSQSFYSYYIMSSHGIFDHDDDHHKQGHAQYNQPNYRQPVFNSYQKQNHSESGIRQLIFEKIRNNPGLKAILVFGVILVVGVVIMLIILLFPLLQKLISSIGENGLQGIVDTIWKGKK